MGKHRGFICLGIIVFALAVGQIFPYQRTVEVSVPEGTHLALKLNDNLSTKLNIEGDRFTADVLVPVTINDRIVIPKGSIITGSIARIIRPGRVRGKAWMNLLFQSIRLPGKGEVPIVASLSTLDSEGKVSKDEGSVQGESSKGKDAARVTTPVLTGAGIGGLIGGGKAAAIGGGVGAIIGIATVFSTRGKDLEIRRGSTLDIVLDRPLPLSTDTDGSAAKNR